MQLNDNYYKKSGFDRGHMSRREDANWGTNAIEAKRNADLTCIYTNACQQVPKLNRGGSDAYWNRLERFVLERGVIKEVVGTNKITIFNGPIFESNDPVYRGVQVPLSFFKVICWLNDALELRVSAFKLHQKKLVSIIDFESIDIDQNVEFKEFQCSLSQLQVSTKIDFSHLSKYDTFISDDGKEKELTNQIAMEDLFN